MKVAVVALLLAAPAAAGAQALSVCAATSPTVAKDAPAAVIPITVVNNHVYVRVCAAGQPLDFLLDTGAPSSFFDLGAARRLGIGEGSSFRARGAGAGSVAGANLDRAAVTLAGSGVAHPIQRAIDFSGIAPREGRPIQGVLGHDFIERFVVAIDYRGGELRLHDKDRFRYDGPGAVVPLHLAGNAPHVDAEVRLADGETIRGRMLVDVGAGQALSLTKRWTDEHRLRERVTPTVRRRAGSGVGGAVSADIGRVEVLRIGGVELARPITALHGDSAGVFTENGAWVGNIGGEVLRRFTVYLDYGRRRLILEPHADTREAFEADMSGLSVVLDSTMTRLVVDEVVAASPAGEAGLARGDTIVTVDGHPAATVPLSDLRRRFRREGERVELGVRRGGETRIVTLTLRRMI